MVQYKSFTNWNRGKILYYMEYKVWPPIIDHINGNSLDDRISNLREITLSKNAYNCRFRKISKTLPIGVSIDSTARGNKVYQAQFKMFDKTYKKRFYNSKDAHEYYKKKMISYYGSNDELDYYLTIKQNSLKWHFLRHNRWTGSRAIHLLRGKPLPDDSSTYQSGAMRRGKVLEPQAIQEYEREMRVSVIRNVAAVINTKYPTTLYSPDGIVGKILLEVKCLNEERHKRLLQGDIPPEYIAQIQFGMVITGLRKAQLLAFNPEFEKQLTIIDIPYDKAIAKNIRRRLRADMKNRQST